MYVLLTVRGKILLYVGCKTVNGRSNAMIAAVRTSQTVLDFLHIFRCAKMVQEKCISFESSTNIVPPVNTVKKLSGWSGRKLCRLFQL
jgi:hypothetical protein